MSELFERFRANYLANNEAFNSGDFAKAFVGIPEDLEWHPYALIPGARTLHNRAAVADFFAEEVKDALPDLSSEVLEFIEARPDAFIVHFRNRGTGRSSGLAVEHEIFQVWEVGRRPVRVQEFRGLDEAWAAIGAD